MSGAFIIAMLNIRRGSCPMFPYPLRGRKLKVEGERWTCGASQASECCSVVDSPTALLEAPTAPPARQEGNLSTVTGRNLGTRHLSAGAPGGLPSDRVRRWLGIDQEYSNNQPACTLGRHSLDSQQRQPLELSQICASAGGSGGVSRGVCTLAELGVDVAQPDQGETT